MSDRSPFDPQPAEPNDAAVPALPPVERSGSDEENSPEFYRDSGVIPFAAFTVMPAVCFLVAALGGIAYSYLMSWIPFIIAHIIIAVMGAMGLTRFMNWAIVKWKVRSIPYAMFLVVATSGVAFYCAWATDILARFGFQAVGGNPLWAWYPPVLANYIAEFYREGFWSSSGGSGSGKTVSGPWLAMHWLAEAAAFFGIPFREVWKTRNTRAFCGHCNRWTDAEVGIVRYYPGSENELAERLKARDFTALAERLGIPDAYDIFLRLNVHACPGCRITRLVTIERVEVAKDSNGTQKIKLAPVIDRMEVDDATLQEILALSPPHTNNE